MRRLFKTHLIVPVILLIAASVICVSAFGAGASSEHIHCICAGGECEGHSGATFTEWNDPDSLPTRAGYYYLGCDVTLGGKWEPRGNTFLCLNGHAIRRSSTESTPFSMISVKGGVSLTVTDCSSHSEYSFGVTDDGLYTEGGGDMTLISGIITGGRAADGGAVKIDSRGTFTLYGGNIVGNTADGGSGGAIYNAGTLNIRGGSVIGNTAPGGAGGGIYTRGTAEIVGGRIEANRANTCGGAAVRGGTVTVGGSVRIINNYVGDVASNLHLYSGVTVALSDVGDECLVGVSSSIAPSEESGVAISKLSAAASDALGAFFPDDPAYEIRNEGGVLYLATSSTVYYDILTENGEHGLFSVMVGNEPVERAAEGEIVRISAAPDIGYKVSYISVIDATGNDVAVSEDGTFTMPDSSVTVRVAYEKRGALTPRVEPGDSHNSVVYGYSGAYLSVKVDIEGDLSDYTLDYTWYMSDSKIAEGGIELIGEKGAYCALPDGLNAGVHYFYCTVLATRVDNNESATGVSPVMTLTVDKILIDIPLPDESEFTYNGKEQIFRVAEGEHYTVSGKRQTGANEDGHDVSVTLCDKVNYAWRDGSSEDIVYKFVIKRATPKITLDAEHITRRFGDPLALPGARSTFGEAILKTDLGEIMSVGEYEIVYSVPESENWFGASAVMKLTVTKADYDMSGISFSDKTVIADGEMHSIEIEGDLPDGVSVAYSLEGASLAGVYTVTASFVGDDNHNPIPDMSAVLTIALSELNAAVGESEVKMKAEGGISPLAVLSVNASDLSANATLLAYIKQGEQIGASFDIRIIIDGVSTQPTGPVSIYLPIPTDRAGESFRILHIHAANEIEELKYTVDGEYAVITVSRLSYFTFVYEAKAADGDPDAPGVTPPAEPGDGTTDNPDNTPDNDPEDKPEDKPSVTPPEGGDGVVPDGEPTDKPLPNEPSDTPSGETGDGSDMSGGAENEGQSGDDLGAHLRAFLEALAEAAGRFDPLILIIPGVALLIVISIGIAVAINNHKRKMELLEELERERRSQRIMSYGMYNEEE